MVGKGMVRRKDECLQEIFSRGRENRFETDLGNDIFYLQRCERQMCDVGIRRWRWRVILYPPVGIPGVFKYSHLAPDDREQA